MAKVTSIEEATVLARKYTEFLSGAEAPMKLFADLTQDHEFGWVFFFGPVDAQIAVGGNAPFIVARSDGSIHTMGTAHPIERYIESYRRVGRAYPFATARHVVTLDGWQPGMQKISLTKLIRDYACLDLAAATRATDHVLAKTPVHLTFASEAQADEFLSQAHDLGATGHRSLHWE